MREDIKNSVENSTVIFKGDYPYIITPLMDGVPSVDPKVMRSMAEKMASIGRFDCDLILAPEAMAIPYATLISQIKDIPFSVIRKRPYHLPGETEVVEMTGYSTTKIYINGVKPGMKVVVVDDVVSTGGTLKGIVNGLRDIGANVTEIVLALNKCNDIFALEKEIGVPIKYVAKIWIEDGKPRCLC